METSKFVKNPNNVNEILIGDKFYISYNMTTGAGNPLSLILSEIVSLPNGEEETALCVEDSNTERGRV